MKYLLLQASSRGFNPSEFMRKYLQSNGFTIEEIEFECGHDKEKGYTIDIATIADFNNLYMFAGSFVFGYELFDKLPKGVKNTILIYDDYIE